MTSYEMGEQGVPEETMIPVSDAEIPVASLEYPPIPAEETLPSAVLGEPEILDPETSPALETTLPETAEEPTVLEGEVVSETLDTMPGDGGAGGIEGQQVTEAEGGGRPSYAVETYTEFGKVERKRFESLLMRILSAIIGLNPIEVGPVVRSYTRVYPIEFQNYLANKIQGGDLAPSFDEIGEKFPGIFDADGEDASATVPEMPVEVPGEEDQIARG